MVLSVFVFCRGADSPPVRLNTNNVVSNTKPKYKFTQVNNPISYKNIVYNIR